MLRPWSIRLELRRPPICLWWYRSYWQRRREIEREQKKIPPNRVRNGLISRPRPLIRGLRSIPLYEKREGRRRWVMSHALTHRLPRK